MKIFSLETKKQKVWWSIILGIVTSLIVSKLSYRSYIPQCVELCASRLTFGYPWRALDGTQVINTFDFIIKIIADTIFWTLVVFMILFIIRHFRNKQNQVPVKAL